MNPPVQCPFCHRITSFCRHPSFTIFIRYDNCAFEIWEYSENLSDPAGQSSTHSSLTKNIYIWNGGAANNSPGIIKTNKQIEIHADNINEAAKRFERYRSVL